MLIFSFAKIFQNTMVSIINFRITAVAKIQTGKVNGLRNKNDFLPKTMILAKQKMTQNE